MSIILILTSSSINFKWLIRPESPRATSLLAPSPSSSLSGFLTILFFAAHYTRIVPILAHSGHTHTIPPSNSKNKCSKNIVSINTSNLESQKKTNLEDFRAHMFFVFCVFFNHQKGSSIWQLCSITKGQQSVCQLLHGATEGGLSPKFPSWPRRVIRSSPRWSIKFLFDCHKEGETINKCIK